jgi:hypothetical protein
MFITLALCVNVVASGDRLEPSMIVSNLSTRDFCTATHSTASQWKLIRIMSNNIEKLLISRLFRMLFDLPQREIIRGDGKKYFNPDANRTKSDVTLQFLSNTPSRKVYRDIAYHGLKPESVDDFCRTLGCIADLHGEQSLEVLLLLADLDIRAVPGEDVLRLKPILIAGYPDYPVERALSCYPKQSGPAMYRVAKKAIVKHGVDSNACYMFYAMARNDTLRDAATIADHELGELDKINKVQIQVLRLIAKCIQ